MIEGTRRKLLAATLLGALVVTAAAMIGPLDGSWGLVRGGGTGRSVSITKGQAPGTLIIDVSFERRSSSAPLMGLISRYQPTQGATVSISRTDQIDAPPVVEVTNGSGLLRFSLHPSENYVATLRDSRINVTVPFQVFSNRITSLIIRANRVSYHVILEDIHDQGLSGWVAPWQSLFLETPEAGIKNSTGSTLFLEINPAIATFSVLRPSDVSLARVVIVSEQAENNSLWVELEPTAPLRVADLANCSLVDYVPSYSVSIA